MAGLGCFIKDTSVVNDMRDVMSILAGVAINNDRRFTVQDAYKYLRSKGVEVDVESVAAVYEDTFHLDDGNFSSQEEVDEFSGRVFSDTLDNLVNEGGPTEEEKRIGALSPGKAAAKQIVDFFSRATKIDAQPKSVMLQFQEMMKKAAMRMADKTGLPQKPSAKETRSFDEILADALEFQDNTGFRTLSGTMNNAADLVAEFKAEVDAYKREMKAKGADQSRIDEFDAYSNQMVDAAYTILLSQKEAKKVIIDALIDKGFAKTKKDGTKDIDWDKVSNGTGMPHFIRDNVSEALSEKGFTDEQIARINKSLVKEYNDITAFVIERAQQKIEEQNKRKSESAQKELDRRNKVSRRQQSIDAKRMARLYNLGFFELTPRTYENLLNKMVGMSDVDQKTFDQLKVFGQALSTLYAAKITNANGEEVDAPEFIYRDAINAINERIGSILRQNQNSNSKLLLIARVFDNYISAGMRMVLTGAKNMIVQNPLSGFVASKTSDLYIFLTEKSDTAELRAQRKNFGKAVFNDIVNNRGEHYGDVSSTFYARSGLDHLKNKIDDALTGGVGKRSEFLQRFLSFNTGKMMLDGVDSRFKANITQKYLINNIYKILTAASNPNKMSKEDATNFIAENLLGIKYEQAVKQAEQLVETVNSGEAGKILSNQPAFIVRLANDIVKANLVATPAGSNTPAISIEQLEAAYEAAYKAAGRDLGHVANNIVSKGVNAVGGEMSTYIEAAVKNKEYNHAAIMTIAQSLYRNLLNPFVGGATNWVMLKAEKNGLGVIAGGVQSLVRKLEGKTVNTIDLSDPKDVAELEKVLYRETVEQMKLARGTAGAITSALLFFAAKAAIYAYYDADDDKEKEEALKKYAEWKKQNFIVSKYLDEFTSEYLLVQLAAQNDELGKYFTKVASLDNPNSPTAKISQAVKLYETGDVAESRGKLGEVAGAVVNLPVPWRFYRDIVDVSAWSVGKYRPDEYIKSRSFIHGVLRNGLFYDIGMKYTPKYELSSLPGVSGKTVERLSAEGINNMNDLKKYKGRLGELDYKDAAGRKKKIFDTKQRVEIDAILSKQ